MASFIVTKLPNGMPVRELDSQCMCSLVPDYLLQDIVSCEHAPEHARASARVTLEHNRAIRAHRLGNAQRRGHHAAQQGAIPRFFFQDILDSAHSSEEDKRRAQSNLDTLSSLGSQKESVAGLAAVGGGIPHVKRIIYDAKRHSRIPGTKIRAEGAPATQDVSGTQVYDYFGLTHDVYGAVFERNSIDNQGLTLEGTIHYDDDDRPPGFNNAFWNGERMVFGDGDNIMFSSFTKDVDVIAHELTHGVTEHTANLPYWSQSGALNESISDVFGSIVKQYGLKQTADKADWLIGATIFAKGFQGRALRDMANPGTAYNDPSTGAKDRQVAHMSKYLDWPLDEDHDNGGVHVNSGIPNRAFYLVAAALGGNSWDVAGKIWYKCLLDPRLNTFARSPANYTKVFGYFAALTLDNAKPYGQKAVDAVKNAWTTVGVTAAVLAPSDGGDQGGELLTQPKPRGIAA